MRLYRLLPAFLLFAGCATGEDGPGTVEWTLSDSTVLSIGELEGDPAYLFQRIVDIAVLPDGGVAVADVGSTSVRFFDGDGRLTATAGRQGEGPGELATIDGMWGDESGISVFDHRLGRVTRFDLEGRRTDLVEIGGSGRPLDLFLGPLASGGFAAAGVVPRPEGRSASILLDSMRIVTSYSISQARDLLVALLADRGEDDRVERIEAQCLWPECRCRQTSHPSWSGMAASQASAPIAWGYRGSRCIGCLRGRLRGLQIPVGPYQWSFVQMITRPHVSS